jgi:hypothetical protein
MSRTFSNILFLAAGAAIGAAAVYVATSDKRDEWLESAAKMVDRIKNTVAAKNSESSEKQ